MERGSASRPTSFYSQTSTDSCCSAAESKVEMRNLMDSFIADVQRIRDSFTESPAGAAPAASPARSDADVDMAPPVPGAYTVEPTTPPEEYEHKGIWCDSCNQKVFGVRHKCLDCYNFDLCNPCMTTKDIQSTHADMPHTFEAIHPPKPQPAPKPAPKAAPIPRGRPQPPSATSTTQCLCSVLPRPLGCPICKPRGAKNEHPVRALSYRCDSCQKTISGTRHRCMNCPDFDLCDSCYTAGSPTPDHPPVHRFMHIEDPIRIITAPVISSGSLNSLCAGCAHEGPRYKCETCGAVDLCMSCLGDLEQAVIEHSAFHAEQGWDKPVRFVPYAKDPKQSSSSTSSTSTAAVHPADCDACDKTIVGTRHKCTVCFDFDLCDSCFASGAEPLGHKADHEMLHLDRPQRVVTHVVGSGNGAPSVRPISVSSTATATPGTLHQAWCDGCSERIRGVRHKCLDCDDFDFCDACLGRDHFGGAHEFYALVEPGEVAVRSVRQPARAAPPEPAVRPRGLANGRVKTTPAPVPPSHHQPRPARPARNTAPVTHAAACDLCSTRIRGVRYKCTVCPDYDVCDSCFRLSEDVHPGHSFAKIHNQGDIIVRKSSRNSLRHHARCDACQNQILGIRYKCIHPSCPDFDICERCEALPFPVHPETHAFVKLRSHVSNYDGLTNVFSFAAGRSPSPQPQPSTLRVPTPIVRIPSPRVQVPSPRISRSPAPVIVEPITATEAFHTATPSPVVPLSSLGCTIVPHTTIVANIPQSPLASPAHLSPRIIPPPVIPSPPRIPTPLLSQTPTPEKKLTDSWTAVSPNAKLDEHKMHHSSMYKPSYEAPAVVPARTVVEQPKPIRSQEELYEARIRELQQKIEELSRSSSTVPESPKLVSPVRGVTVQEERDPEAPQMTLLNLRPVSLPDVPAREPVVRVFPELVPEPVVPEPVPEPVVVPELVPEPVVVPEPVATPEPELPALIPPYTYRDVPGMIPAPLPIAPSLSSQAPSIASSTSTLSSLDVPALNAAFVEDRSIVDGQVVSGGAEFAKCWRMRNTGTTAWPNGTTISFVGGHNMLIESDMVHWAVSGDLSPGQDVDVEVDMKAPEEPGRYTSYWRLKNPDGEAFGARVWCDIIVAEPEGAGSSGSSEIAASSIIIPHAPGMSAASVISPSASPTIHSVHSTIHTASVMDSASVIDTASVVDTADIESIGSMDSDDSDVWEEVRRRTAAAAARSEADRFEMVYDSEA